MPVPTTPESRNAVALSFLEDLRSRRTTFPFDATPRAEYWEGRNTLKFWVEIKHRLNPAQQSVLVMYITNFCNAYGTFDYDGIKYVIDIPSPEIVIADDDPEEPP